jgi:hypothetical protein
VDLIACDNPYSAFASLCTAGAGDDRARPMLLVLIEPSTLLQAARVLVLAEQHVPHAARWAYEASAEVKLRAVTSALVANLHRAGPVPLPAVVTRSVGSPTVSPAAAAVANGTHGEIGKPLPPTRDVQAQKSPILALKDDLSHSLGLTAEELAMLLADAPKDKGESRGPSGADR